MEKKYSGPERRKYPRAEANFVVSYVIKEIQDDYDLTQSRNVSQGGILITTNRYFSKGVKLAMHIRLPFITQRIEVTGEVVDCKEKVKNLIYETRIKFLDLDMGIFEEIGKHIEKFLKK